MKSSSSLFPVALMRAEVLSSEYIEDTYLLKPNNSSDLTVQVALSRLGYYDSKDEIRGQPVVLLHGGFSNKGVWLDSQLNGAAKELLESGFDPWMLEMRGHGDSPENMQFLKNSLETYAQYDLPAVQDFVYEQTNQKVVWVGHSSGGVCIATSVAGQYLDENKTAGVVLFGAQVSKYPFVLYIPFIRSLIKIWLLTKSRLQSSKLGPELEPRGVGLEFVRWSGLFTRWKSKKSGSFWKLLNKSNIPVLGFGAKKDSGDPARCCEKLVKNFGGEKEFHHLSKLKGFSMNYNHGNMVKSDQAYQEIWPLVSKWIQSLKS